MGSITVEGACSDEYLETMFKRSKKRFSIWLMTQRLKRIFLLPWNIVLGRGTTSLRQLTRRPRIGKESIESF
jgi:hypothetical protein